jgi:hypothetical protein
LITITLYKKKWKLYLNSIDNYTLTSLGLSRSPGPSASIYLLRSIGRNSRYKHRWLQPVLYVGSNATWLNLKHINQNKINYSLIIYLIIFSCWIDLTTAISRTAVAGNSFSSSCLLVNLIVFRARRWRVFILRTHSTTPYVP